MNDEKEIFIPYTNLKHIISWKTIIVNDITLSINEFSKFINEVFVSETYEKEDHIKLKVTKNLDRVSPYTCHE